MTAGCLAAHELHERRRTPRLVALKILGTIIPPQDVDGAVVRNEFVHLGVEVVEVLGVVARAVRIGLAFQRVRELLRFLVAVLVVMPVNHRVIEAHAQTLRAGRVDDFAHEVAVEFRAGIVVADLRVVQREAVVVFRGEDDVAAARRLREPRPFAGEAGRGLEERQGALRVGVGVGLHPLLNPLHAPFGADGLAVPCAGQTRVKPPMHKHPEACLAPPGHPGIPLGG